MGKYYSYDQEDHMDFKAKSQSPISPELGNSALNSS